MGKTQLLHLSIVFVLFLFVFRFQVDYLIRPGQGPGTWAQGKGRGGARSASSVIGGERAARAARYEGEPKREFAVTRHAQLYYCKY